MDIFEMLASVVGPVAAIFFVVIIMIIFLILLWMLIETATRWQAQAAFEQAQIRRQEIVRQHIQDLIDYDMARDGTAGRETTEWKELEPVVAELQSTPADPGDARPGG